MDFHGRKLDETLLSIEALVDDAEQKKFRDPRVRGWHFAAKDVVFDTEDLLDEIDYELSKCQVESEFQTFTFKVTNVGSSGLWIIKQGGVELIINVPWLIKIYPS